MKNDFPIKSQWGLAKLKKKNVFNRNDNIVKVHRKQCHGDFCGYRDKNVKSDDEDEEEED